MNIHIKEIWELKNCGVSQQKTVLNTRGTGRAESTQRQLHVFMALLRVSRLRVSADPQVLKVARNKVENASFAQRSAHRDSRIWRPELIEPGRRAQTTRAQTTTDVQNRPTPTHRFCHSAIFRPITPYNVWFFWVSRHRAIILAKKWKHFRADFEKFQEMS